jgi:porin
MYSMTFTRNLKTTMHGDFNLGFPGLEAAHCVAPMKPRDLTSGRCRWLGLAAALATVVAGFSPLEADPPAPAQTAAAPAVNNPVPPNNSPAAAADAASAAGATAPSTPTTTFWTQPTLTGNWGGLRDTLADDGFTPFASWIGEIWGNANGGIQTGMTQDMLFSTGFDANFEKLIGWTGGGFHAELHWTQGQNAANNTGSLNNPTNYAAANSVRMYSLYFTQTLLSQQLSLKAGQFGADQDFLQTTSAGMFLNGGITAPPLLFSQVLVNGDSAVAQYPVAAPAVWARFDSKALPVYAQAGLYNGDPGPDAVNNHGFKWQTGSNSGLLVVSEAGWNYTVANLTGTLKAGGFYHSGAFTNWTNGLTGRGIYGFYTMLEQTILQTSDGKGGFNPLLSAYAYAGWAGPDKLVNVNVNLSAGVNWHGPIPGRDQDMAGVAVLYNGFSAAYTSSPFNPLGAGVTTASETDLEFTYIAVVTPWFSVQPDAQVIFNPALATTRATATVVGVRAVVTF